MSRFKNRLVKRVMAVILSGAMVMSCMPSSNMTAFASEAPIDTGGGYISEAEDIAGTDDTGIENAENEADDKAADVSAKEETTSKDEDNASSNKQDDNEDADEDAKESDAADEADGDDSADDKASETKSSLSAEEMETEETETEDSEEEDNNEDVKADFTAMTFDSTTTSYIFNAADIAESIAANTEVITDDGAFALICGNNTVVDNTAKSKFYFWDAEQKNIVADATTKKAVNMGDDAAKNCAIKFQVSQPVDVTVYWVANAADSQMSILNDNGETVMRTCKVPDTAKPNKLSISTMTLKESGTYYLGGNNKVYKVRVEPEITKRTSWDWTITDTANAGFLSGQCATTPQGDAAAEYFDLRVDVNTGKFAPRPSDVQTNEGTIIHVPVSGRSNVTFTMQNTSYTVDGIAATATEQTFACAGEGGYATLRVTGSNQYLKKIKVVPVSTVGVSGKVTLTGGTLKAGTQVIFTEDTENESKTVISADIDENGNYSADLYTDVTYNVSLSEKNYNISEGNTIKIEKGETSAKSLNITVSEIPLEDVEGSIIFPESKQIPSDLKLQFTSEDESHVTRDVTINGSKYTVALKPGESYKVEVIAGTRIDDYILNTDKINSTDKDITFVNKQTEKVNVTVNTVKTGGIKDIDLSDTKIVFTRVNEEDYTYSFTGIDDIQLRKGTYSITEMDMPYPYWFDFSKTFDVEDAEVDVTLDFSERMTWNFLAAGQAKDLMLQTNKPSENVAGDQEYHGLLVETNGSGKSGKFNVNSGNVQVNQDTQVKIPVSGKGTVTITTSNGYLGYNMNNVAAAAREQSWSYDEAAATYDENGKYVPGGYMTLVATAGTYLEKIEITRDEEPEGGNPGTEYIAEGTIKFYELEGLQENDVPSIKGITLNNILWHDDQHGLVASNGATMGLKLSKKANITVVTCCYGANESAKITASSGSVTSEKTTELDTSTNKYGLQFDIAGADAGDLTLTFSGDSSVFVHSITVEYVSDVTEPTGPRKIDVWDFGGKVETDTNKYTNNITPQQWLDSNLLIAKGEEGSEGRFRGGSNQSYTYSFGDLTMYYVGQDRLYSNLPELANIVAGATGNGSNNAYSDGYTAAGGWYGNGSGSSNTEDLTKDNTRNMTIKAMAGDTIVLYAGQHMSNGDEEYGPITYHFEGAGQHDAQALSNDTGRVYKMLVFVAEHTGTYKIWPECERKGKPMYNRVMRIPGVTVSGTINYGDYTGTGHSVIFVNEDTGAESKAQLDGNNFTVSLAVGHRYTAILTGAAGFGFSDEDDKTVEPTEENITDGITGISLNVIAKDMYAYTGQITGFAQDYNTEKLAITMTPPEDTKADKVRLTINDDLSFQAQLESGLEYTIEMEGVDDYKVKEGGTTVTSQDDLNQNIEVQLKDRYTVKGGFIGLKDAEVTKLTFTMIDENGNPSSQYVYNAASEDITANGYTIALRDGTYVASAEVSVSGYSTSTHVVVKGSAVNRDLFFVSTAVDPDMQWVPDLYVDKNDPEKYQTVTEAVKAAKCMDPTSEEERITIHIAPGVYREQILVDVPYLTFKNDTPSEEVKLTWYYGIGYEYYSAKGGYYNEASAYDKYERYEVSDWGTTVRLNAPNFRAENIVFENSFNQYITDEEIADGVQPAAGSGKPARTKGVDVESSNYKERAAVMYINKNADFAEFYRCSFISNQDTLGSGKAGTHSYFKECLIEGTTDYICGGGDCVFDECELRWAGQSDKPAGGYITAPNGTDNKGYLFLNCTISANENRQVSAGYLGRPWGADAKAVFINTILGRADLVTAVGWNDMGDNLSTILSNGGFKEYNTTFNGNPVDVSGRLAGTVADKAFADAITVEDYFGAWEPLYYNYVEEPATTETRSIVPKGTKIELSCSTRDAQIYYTTDGSEPTESSTPYNAEAGIVLDEITDEIVIRAIAVKNGKKSAVADFAFQVVDPATFVDMPRANQPNGHVFEIGGGTVTLEAESDAEIYYIKSSEPITDIPDSASTPYTEPIEITGKTYINAVAIKNGKSSEVLELHYDVKREDEIAPPTANPNSGSTIKIGDYITLLPETASIYFRINGDPLDESTLYETPIIVDETMVDNGTVTVNAYVEQNGRKSIVASFTYTVEDEDVSEKEPDDPGEDMSDIQITGLEKSYYYTGAKITPDIKVWDCDIKGNSKRLLIEGTDYTVKYANNTKETTPDKPATVTVVGKGNYSGKDVTETFEIKVRDTVKDEDAIDIKGAKIADKISDMPYTGSAQYPSAFTLTLKDKTTIKYEFDSTAGEYVREDKQQMNVNVAVSNNVNKGTATILVTGKKDAKGKVTSVKKTFKITPIDLSANADKITVTASDAEYAVKGAIPSVTVKYDGTTLKNGKDYTVKYAKNKKAGEKGTVTITGKGNYTKKCSPVEFNVKQLDLSKLTVKAVTAYDGIDASKIKATIVDKDGNALKASQYTLMVYKAETGEEVYGKGDKLVAETKIYVAAETKDTTNLTGTTPRAEFTVGIDISKAKIALKKVNGKAATKEYTGSAITLTADEMEATIKVKGESTPRTLQMSADNGLTGDYEIVSYTNNIDKGTATAVIKGIGQYSGTKTIKFKIVPQNMVKGTTTTVSGTISDVINNLRIMFAH